jgi:hypothetical protein
MKILKIYLVKHRDYHNMNYNHQAFLKVCLPPTFSEYHDQIPKLVLQTEQSYSSLGQDLPMHPESTDVQQQQLTTLLCTLPIAKAQLNH